MSRTVRVLMAACLSGTVCSLAGCNIIGAAGVLISGPPKVPAQTELDETRPTVLLIDDLNTRLPRASLRDSIGRAAEEQMLRQDVIDDGRLLASTATRRVVAADTNEARTSIVDAGRLVGAEVVVHVAIEQWTLNATQGEVSPEAVISVKVLDTLRNERLWPIGEAPFVTAVELPVRADRRIESAADRRIIEDTLAERIGVAIAKLFYTSERERISEQREFN